MLVDEKIFNSCGGIGIFEYQAGHDLSMGQPAAHPVHQVRRLFTIRPGIPRQMG